MDKTEIINAIFGACRLHSWLELVSETPTDSIQVKVMSTMLPEAINVLQEEIGEEKSQDIPVTIEGNVITFENLTGRDYDGERYQIEQYSNKI